MYSKKKYHPSCVRAREKMFKSIYVYNLYVLCMFKIICVLKGHEF